MELQAVKISDFLKRVRDPVAIENDNKYKLVTIRLYHKGVILRKEVYGSEIGAKTMSRLKEGQFILSGIDARNGAFGIVPKELDGAVVTNDFWHFEINHKIISKEYFFWLTTTEFFDDICKKASDGTTNRIRLQADRFFSQILSIPDIKYQNQVIEIYKINHTKLQSLQGEQSKQLKLLDDLNQAILQEAVQGKLVPQDPQEGNAKDLLLEIQKAKSASVRGKKSKPLPPIREEEIPFSIPKNWVWVRLGEVCEIFGGGTPSMGKREYWNGDIPWVSPKDMKTDYITDTQMKITNKGIENSAAKLIRKNSILVVGRSGILKRTFPVAINKCECTVNQDMKVLIPLSIMSPFYLFYLLKGLEYIILARFVKYGMTVHSLKYSEFESMCVPLPPLAEQKRIVSAIERERERIAELKREVEFRQVGVENLGKAILQEAFG